MANLLRDRRTAAEWAAAGQVIEITEKLGGFERLAAVVEADLAALEPAGIPGQWRDSPIVGSLEFGFADARGELPRVRCRLAATLDAVCQRCLKLFRHSIETEADLLLLKAEEAANGYEDHEIWELEQSTLRPIEIVEELLIMALPLSAMHVDLASCSKLSPEPDQQDERTRPFAALRAQMTRDQ